MGAVPGGFKGAGHADQHDRAHVSNPLMSGLAARDFLPGCAVHHKLCKRAVLLSVGLAGAWARAWVLGSGVWESALR